jgi:hypothetical protein
MGAIMDYMTLQTIIDDLDRVLTLRQVSELRTKYEALAEAIEEEMSAEFELEMDDGA